MSEHNLEIRCIRVGELDAFARQVLETIDPAEVVPISRSRSHAYATNPNAHPDDMGLIVAYEDERCVGFLGMIPGSVQVDGELEPMYWLSSWYVAPEARHTGAGAMLILRALALRRPIVVTGFSEEAARVYEGLRFVPLGPLRYVQADFKPVNVLGMPLRLVRKLLGRLGREETPRLDEWVRWVDGLGARGLHVFLGQLTSRLDQELELKSVACLTDDTFEGAPAGAPPARFCRGVDDINWMLRDRWVATTVAAATERYHFRDFDRLFDYRVIELYSKQDKVYKGVVVMRIDGKWGRRNLTVLDYYFPDVADRHYLVPLALKQARADWADVINLPDGCREGCEASWLLRHLVRDVERTYFCHPGRRKSLIGQAKDQLTLHLADGDQGFA